ncbi:MAG: sigma-70 family RNA polymerase sigma factor [Pseudomonadota bacterium]
MDVQQLKPLLIQRLPRLRRFARTLTAHGADADDLVQEACLRAIERAAMLRRQEQLDSWMFSTMRNIWIDEQRRRTVRTGSGLVDSQETDELRTVADAADALGARQLTDQILGLPDGLSSVLLLVTVEGYSYRETADILNIPIGTVMSRMSRARGMIAQAIGHDGKGERS